SCFGPRVEDYVAVLSLTDHARETLMSLRMSEAGDLPERVRERVMTSVMDLDDPGVEVEELASADGPRQAIALILEDGTKLVMANATEMLVLDGDDVESVFAETLSPGDRIAVMKDAVTRSIFDGVLARVHHLINVDQRVIDLWRNCVRR